MTRLKGELAAEESTLAANKASLAASRKELTANNKLVTQAEANQRRYNKAIGDTPDHFVRPAARSASAFINNDVEVAKNEQSRAAAQVREYEQAVKASTEAVKNLKPQVSAASAVQNELANQTERASSALAGERDTLSKARTELASIKDVSQQANQALGTVSITQEQVSAASQKMAASLARTQQALATLNKFSTGKGDFVDPKAAAAFQRQNAAIEQARADMKALQDETNRLAIALKNSSGNVTQQVNAFDEVARASRAAEQEFRRQNAVLNQMRGVTQTTFKAWAQATIPLKELTSATSQVSSTASKAASGLRQIAPAAQQTGAALGAAARQTTLFGIALDAAGKNGRQTGSVLETLRGQILSVTAGYLGFQAAVSQVTGAVDAFRQLQATQSRLGAVFNQDTSKVAAEIQFLQQQADRLGISFGTLADEYGKFTVAAKTSNFTIADTRKIFLSVAEAARVNSLSTEQMSGVFLALTQMISKGKVSAEELRQQLGDRLTGAFAIFAAAIGKSTAELDQLMQKGEVFADRTTLLKFAEQLSTRFGSQLPAVLRGLETDLGRFQNNVFNAQLAVASGLVPALQDALKSFDAFSKSTEGQDTFRNLGRIVGQVIQVLAEIPKYFDLITLAAKAFVAVKVSEVFVGLIGSATRSTQAISAFSRELQLIGPRTAEAAASQNVLTRGLANTVSTLGIFRNSLLASTSQTSLARIGVAAMAGAVGGLRAALILTASVARSFLAAFGGPIGIAITGITLLVGNWLTSIDKATTAVEEHKRQLDIVVAAYNAAENKAGDWAKKVAGVTIAQTIANVQALKQTFDSTAESADEMARTLKYAFSDFPKASPQIQQLNRLQDALKNVRNGTISIKEFESILNDIALKPTDEQFKDIALRILDITNNSKDGVPSLADLAKSIAEGEAQLRLLNGTATDADKNVLPGLKDAVTETTDAFDKDAALKNYNDAIDKLKSKIPALNSDLKELKEITDLNKSAWSAFMDAFKLGDFSKIKEVLSLWIQARSAVQDATMQKNFDSLPDSRKSLIDRIIYTEGGQDGTGPSTSSARGIGQFTESTWLSMFNQLFPALSQLSDAAKLAYRSNEQYARPILEEFTKRNQMQLANAGVAPTDTNTYLAHFLGAGDAIKVILANPDELAKNIVSADSVKANPSVFKEGTTARDLIAFANKRIGGGSPIMPGGQTKQEGFDADIQQRVKGWKEEAEARKESNREGVIAKALAEAENEAMKAGIPLNAEGTRLSKEQTAAIREAVGAKYDSAHADEQLKANQEEARNQLNDIVGLDQQRKNLLQEINMAQNEGDSGKTNDLLAQLKGVNEQLAAAIPKALELAKTLGDEKMVAQLQKVQLNTAKVGQQFSFLGLSLNSTKQLAVNFADGFASAFDSFAQNVVAGQNAFVALRNAFLQFAADFLRQIATMILKAAAFRLINSVFPGLGIGVPTGHTGGVVGGSAIGTGNQSREVSPTWFMNPIYYHGGGIAGLRPDEVPTVLRKGEEVLTENDPNHRNNRTRDGGSRSQPTSLKQVLAVGDKEIAAAMSGASGEQVFLTHLKRNAPTVRKMIGA